jgi:EKC/KEOPS complex subunit CGI121/TPRKB
MVALVTAVVPQAPPVQPVKIALFEDVHEISSLIEKLRSGTLAFGMIDARTVSANSHGGEAKLTSESQILSKEHLLAAAFRALNDQSNGRMKTRNVHSEVLLALNINNNVGLYGFVGHRCSDLFRSSKHIANSASNPRHAAF